MMLSKIKHEEIFDELYFRAEEYLEMMTNNDDKVDMIVDLAMCEIYKLRQENEYLKKRVEHATRVKTG